MSVELSVCLIDVNPDDKLGFALRKTISSLVLQTLVSLYNCIKYIN